MARNNNPWCKIYFRDWLESERVMEMSCAAEGVYMRCLLMQAVRTNLPQSLPKLALLLRKPLEELEKVWHEVAPHFDTEEVDGEVRLYNARHRELLEEDAAKSKNYSKAAKKREQLKRKQDSATILPQSSKDCAVRASVSDSDSDSDSVSASDSKNSKTSKSKSKSKNADDDHLGKSNPLFSEFYASYPRRVNRADAYAAYLKHVKTEADHLALMKATEAAKAGIWEGRAQEHIPYPAVWINKLNWQDDAADLSTPARGVPSQRYDAAQAYRDRIEKFDPSSTKPLTPEEIDELEDLPF